MIGKTLSEAFSILLRYQYANKYEMFNFIHVFSGAPHPDCIYVPPKEACTIPHEDGEFD